MVKRSDSDAPVKEYVYGSLYIDEVILQRTGATDYYFTHDYRYSVTSLTNLSGSIVESYDYKVYGERTASGSGLTDVGYTGQRHDSETGLMYFKNRYYSVSMGSFVTRDPLGYVDGLSMYLGYFGARGMDPMGLDLIPSGWFWTDEDVTLIKNLKVKINDRLKKLNNEFIKEYLGLPKDKCYDDYREVLKELLVKFKKVREYMDKKKIKIYRETGLGGAYGQANIITGNILLNTFRGPNNFFDLTPFESVRGNINESTSEEVLFHELTHLAVDSWDDKPVDFQTTRDNWWSYWNNTSEFSKAYTLEMIYVNGLADSSLLKYKLDAKQCYRRKCAPIWEAASRYIFTIGESVRQSWIW